ncbi:cupin-like domain-containing protein [Pseudomonas sp. PCH446]
MKNAVRHWPAFEKWQRLDYFKAHSRNNPVVVRSKIVSEVIGWSNPEVKAALTEYAGTVYREVPFHQFLDELGHGSDPLVADSCRFFRRLGHRADEGRCRRPAVHAATVQVPALSAASQFPLSQFLHRLAFPCRRRDLHGSSGRGQGGPSAAAGRKQLAGAAASRRRGRLPLRHRYPALPWYRGLQALRTVVEPGDALYIPVYWWHAVQSMDDAFGATVAATFPTPLHVSGDIRSPIARRVLRTYLFSRLAPLVLGAVAYSLAWRLGQRLKAVFTPRDVRP